MCAIIERGNKVDNLKLAATALMMTAQRLECATTKAEVWFSIKCLFKVLLALVILFVFAPGIGNG